MAACELLASLTAATPCPPPSPGLDEADVWLVNRADATFTAGTGNVYTDLVLAGATLAYRCSFHNKGFNYTDEATVNETTGAVSWAPKLNFRMLGFDGATAQSVENLAGTDLVAIVKAKNGKYMVFGSQAGLKLVTNSTGSDADTLGEAVTIGNDEEPSKHWQLLDTDAATTRALLVALES